MNDTVHKLTPPKEPTPTLAELASDMEDRRTILAEARKATARAIGAEGVAASASKAADRTFNAAYDALKTKRPRAKLGEKP